MIRVAAFVHPFKDRLGIVFRQRKPLHRDRAGKNDTESARQELYIGVAASRSVNRINFKSVDLMQGCFGGETKNLGCEIIAVELQLGVIIKAHRKSCDIFADGFHHCLSHFVPFEVVAVKRLIQITFGHDGVFVENALFGQAQRVKAHQ